MSKGVKTLISQSSQPFAHFNLYTNYVGMGGGFDLQKGGVWARRKNGGELGGSGRSEK